MKNTTITFCMTWQSTPKDLHCDMFQNCLLPGLPKNYLSNATNPINIRQMPGF